MSKYKNKIKGLSRTLGDHEKIISMNHRHRRRRIPAEWHRPDITMFIKENIPDSSKQEKLYPFRNKKTEHQVAPEKKLYMSFHGQNSQHAEQ